MAVGGVGEVDGCCAGGGVAHVEVVHGV